MQNTQTLESPVYAQQENVRVVERIVEVRQPVTVEMTGKKYKLWMLIGNLMVVGSIFGALFLVTTNKQPILAVLAVYPFFGGMIIWSIAKFLAWWNNG